MLRFQASRISLRCNSWRLFLGNHTNGAKWLQKLSKNTALFSAVQLLALEVPILTRFWVAILGPFWSHLGASRGHLETILGSSAACTFISSYRHINTTFLSPYHTTTCNADVIAWAKGGECQQHKSQPSHAMLLSVLAKKMVSEHTRWDKGDTGNKRRVTIMTQQHVRYDDIWWCNKVTRIQGYNWQGVKVTRWQAQWWWWHDDDDDMMTR